MTADLHIRPLLMDEYPVDDEETGSINIYVRDGETTASVAVTDHARDYEGDDVAGVDLRLDERDLLALADACAKALAAMGSKGELAELIAETAAYLSAM